MGFADDVLKFQAKALADANKSVCNATEELFTSVVTLSPNSPTHTGKYSQGVVKNSWYTAIGGFDTTVNTTPDANGSSSLSRIKATLATLPFLGKDNTITLASSIPYIQFVESVGWPKDYAGNLTGWAWTGRATPYAMVSTSVTVFKSKYT